VSACVLRCSLECETPRRLEETWKHIAPLKQAWRVPWFVWKTQTLMPLAKNLGKKDQVTQRHPSRGWPMGLERSWDQYSENSCLGKWYPTMQASFTQQYPPLAPCAQLWPSW
jgi:hypothetical protein